MACRMSTATGVMDSNNFELVHTTGMLNTKMQIGDADINYFKEQTFKIHREVEVYQWQEEGSDGRTSSGNSSIIRKYIKAWSSIKINQSHFETTAA